MSEPMPPGIKFLPTDTELVRLYRRQKLIVESLPQGLQKLFLDVAWYQHNPQELIAMHEQLEDDQEDWYFFTPRSRRYLNGQRPTTGIGRRPEKICR
ncbi:UNVERIFIED_CONTAM: NAC domain-containing protein 2 [Sesamum radiatum]|uniref:NAC domain-containing protein 2 n=1 Tax=Sesamum radiatum TaxID=300843 RepID=A0AAW2JIG1_SESRA